MSLLKNSYTVSHKKIVYVGAYSMLAFFLLLPSSSEAKAPLFNQDPSATNYYFEQGNLSDGKFLEGVLEAAETMPGRIKDISKRSKEMRPHLESQIDSIIHFSIRANK